MWLFVGAGRPFAQGLDIGCTTSWTGLDGMAFLAETGSSRLVTMGGAPDGGDCDLAPYPMEMVLLGTDDCTAHDVVLILKQGHQDVQGCGVKLHTDHAETDPRIFMRIHFTSTVAGRNLKRETVERAARLSHEKYCSASIMLIKTAEITHLLGLVNLATQPTVSE